MIWLSSGVDPRVTRGMHSMTGFGRGAAVDGEWQATVELSAVNRKQLEVVVIWPRELAELEARVRGRLQEAVSRGRVQVAVAVEASTGGSLAVTVDETLARSFGQAFSRLGEMLGRPLMPEPADFLRQPGIVTLSNRLPSAEEAWRSIGPALEAALVDFLAMRAREGADLRADLEGRLARLEVLAGGVARQAPERPGRHRELLLKRLRDMGLEELDPGDERLLREVALFADRCDVSEELTRLDSHFAKFREYLTAPAPGRALDFLCQELFREFNTIAAKANDPSIAHAVVEAKTEIEKIREQAQNVE